MPRGPTCSDMQLSFIILAFEEGDLYVSVAVLERKTSQGGEGWSAGSGGANFSARAINTGAAG
jgi:hypothetical protein